VAVDGQLTVRNGNGEQDQQCSVTGRMAPNYDKQTVCDLCI